MSNLNDMNRRYQDPNMNSNQGNIAIYPEQCYVCQRTPLTNIFYYCPNCSQCLCFDCEKKVGMIHDHAYFKIQNMKQYNSTNIPTKKAINQIVEKAEEKIEKVGYKVGKVIEDVKEKISSKIKENKNHSKIKLMRQRYDLSAVSDEQIKKALEANNGDIEGAIASLFSGQ